MVPCACRHLSVAVSWPCQLGVTAYEAEGHRVVVPRLPCPDCRRPMAFDGSYRRTVRRGGVSSRVVVRRARCSSCGVGHALLPDFVLHRRRDSTDAVGAALVGRGAELCAGVPARTMRSWRQRFTGRAELLTAGLMALAVTWGDEVPRLPVAEPAATVAIAAVGAAWWAASRRWPGGVPGPWPLANVILGGELLSTRVDLPWAGTRVVPKPARAP